MNPDKLPKVVPGDGWIMIGIFILISVGVYFL